MRAVMLLFLMGAFLAAAFLWGACDSPLRPLKDAGPDVPDHVDMIDVVDVPDSPDLQDAPDGDIDGDVDGDVVDDPWFDVVECEYGAGHNLPGYLVMTSAWFPYVYLVHMDYVGGSRQTHVNAYHVADKTMERLATLEHYPAKFSQMLVVPEVLKAYWFQQEWVDVGLGTSVYVRHNIPHLYSLDLQTHLVEEIPTPPLASQHCYAQNGAALLVGLNPETGWALIECNVFLGDTSMSERPETYDYYFVNLNSGEIREISRGEDRDYVPKTFFIEKNNPQYYNVCGNDWLAGQWVTDTSTFFNAVWRTNSDGTWETVLDFSLPQGTTSGTRQVTADGWFFWHELIDGMLELRGRNLEGPGDLTSPPTADHHKGFPNPAGSRFPHLIAYVGSPWTVSIGGTIRPALQHNYLWDKETGVIRRASLYELDYAVSAFIPGTDEARYLLSRIKPGESDCIVIRDLWGAGVIDPLTNRLLPEE